MGLTSKLESGSSFGTSFNSKTSSNYSDYSSSSSSNFSSGSGFNFDFGSSSGSSFDFDCCSSFDCSSSSSFGFSSNSNFDFSSSFSCSFHMTDSKIHSGFVATVARDLTFFSKMKTWANFATKTHFNEAALTMIHYSTSNWSTK